MKRGWLGRLRNTGLLARLRGKQDTFRVMWDCCEDGTCVLCSPEKPPGTSLRVVLAHGITEEQATHLVGRVARLHRNTTMEKEERRESQRANG